MRFSISFQAVPSVMEDNNALRKTTNEVVDGVMISGV